MQAVVVDKRLSHSRSSSWYGIRYRLQMGGKTVEWEGNAGDRKTWDAISVGDPITVEYVGNRPEDTRLMIQRDGSSRLYRWIAAALAAAGAVLLILRILAGLGLGERGRIA